MLLGQCYGIPVFYGFSPVCPFLPHMLSPRGCGKGRGNSSRAAHLPFIILSPANYITPVSPLFAARLSSNTMVITIATKNHICKLTITRLVICAFPSNTHPVQLLLQRSPSSLCSPACLPDRQTPGGLSGSPDYNWTPHQPITFAPSPNKPFSSSALSLVSSSGSSPTQT